MVTPRACHLRVLALLQLLRNQAVCSPPGVGPACTPNASQTLYTQDPKGSRLGSEAVQGKPVPERGALSHGYECRGTGGGSSQVGPGKEPESWLRSSGAGGWGRSSVPNWECSSLGHLCPKRTMRVTLLRRQEGLKSRVCSKQSLHNDAPVLSWYLYIKWTVADFSWVSCPEV